MTAISSQQPATRQVIWKKLGLRPYTEVLALQRQLVEQRQRDEAPDTIILCEHPSTYTLGIGAAAPDILDAGNVPVIRIGRGGGATYHGPGQLVGYPILRLRDWGWRVSDYLCALERALIATVQSVGVDAHREGPTRGVYVEERKIASIGIQVSRGVVWHGFALNVSCDLSAFDRITPCRRPGTRMTSLAHELHTAIAMEAVQCAFVQQLKIRTIYGTLCAWEVSRHDDIDGQQGQGATLQAAGSDCGLA